MKHPLAPAMLLVALVSLFGSCSAFSQDATSATADEATQKAAWEKCKAALEAQGEHLDLDYFIPPPVPDDKNFALTPLMKPLLVGTYDEKSGFTPSDPNPPINSIWIWVRDSKAAPPIVMKGWLTGDTRSLEAWQAYYRESLPDLKLSKSPAEDVLTALDRYNGLFAELRQDLQTHPLCRYPLRWDDGFAMVLPHLSTLLKVTTVLGLRASAELELNQPDKALSDLQLAFRLIDTTRNESMLINGLVRVTEEAILLQPIHDGIAAHRWNGQQLEALEKEMQGLDLLSDFDRCIRVERCEENRLFAWAIDDPAWLDKSLSSMGFDESKFGPMKGPAFKAAMYQNQILINTVIQEKFLAIMDEKSRTVNVARAKDAKTSVESLQPTVSTFMAKISMPVFIPLVMKFAREQAYLNEASVACEIERYRLAHGKLPASLDALQAKDLPHDVINGQPLHYRVTGNDNYLLYSVGWNETDDGGKVALNANGGIDSKTSEQGDWVWSLKPL